MATEDVELLKHRVGESKQKRALRWIAGVLEAAGVPYQVVGGLAARAYGAARPLADIDLYVPGGRLEEIAPFVEEHVTFGPGRVVSDEWDLTFMALEYEGQIVELGGADSVWIYDQQAHEWAEQRIDFSTSELRDIYGVTVPVMPRAQLVAYKQRLARDVDLQDISEMRAAEEG